MTTVSSTGDLSPVPTQPSERRGTSVGFFVGTALAIVSIGLFVVSGFVFFSGDAGVAQPVATVLGGAGVFSAGVLTFRAAHNTRISAEKTAAESLAHVRSVAADEKARHEEQFAQQREQAETARAEQAASFERTHRREVLRDLRSRYTTCAAQLAHESAAVRLAGAYALASLADDWQQQDESEEKQVAIDLLRAYLRTPNVHTPALIALKQPDTGELEVRKTILFTLYKRATAEALDPKSWKGSDCVLHNADLSHASLKSATLPGALLMSVNLSNANLSSADLSSADLSSADLTCTDLTFAKLAGANLSFAKLPGADLYFAMLPGANLTYANLPSADLSRANLTGGDLSDADLTGANLTGANLSSADLTDADLSSADFSDAQLDDADLTRANLTDADLTDTVLAGVDLTDANLSNIYYSAATIWPEGVVPPPSRDSPSSDG